MSGEAQPENVLFDWYVRYVGEPTDERDVYAGFGLFFGGIALGLVGVAVFLLGAAVSGATPSFALREIAVVLAAGGLPAALAGAVVLLPGDDRTTYAAVAGTAVCLLAVAVFVWAYPYQWNVARPPDHSALGVGVYAVGLVLTAAATGAALVGHQIERVALLAEQDGSESGPDATGPGDGASVSDEDVRRDIDEAMADAELTWGGVEKTETTRLEFDTDVAEVETNADRVDASETRAEGSNVDDAVSNLRQLQGRGENTASSESTVDDQTAALTELKRKQRAEAAATGDDPDAAGRGDDATGATSRVLDRLRGLVGR
ncbi:MAG: permease [Haloferacaceae archaeon]